jgi:hypothetical protein
MTFPTSPTNGDLHSEFGRLYQYVADTSSWRAATSPAPEITISTVTAFESAVDLPLVNNNPGDTTFIAADNSFRLWTGSGWFEIALVNTAPTITTGANATYALNSDGTPTIVTLAATDPEGTPVVWGHLVTSGSLEDTTVTNVDNVFTITPGAVDATFNLSFTASDGVNIDTSASAFTLSFGPDWSTTALLHTLDNPTPFGTSQNDEFSISIGISGNYAIVGAYQEGDAGGTKSGKAYIFNVTTGALIHILDNPNPYGTSATDFFGYSVAMSGDHVIVGAIFEDDPADAAGKAYIYNVTTGALVHSLSPSNPSGGMWFGRSVSISGNYAIVGAILVTDAGGINSGKAYIFNVTTGALVHTLDNPNTYGTSTNDQFGEYVGISGNYAIVGAASEDDAGGDSSGKAYIFNVTTGVLVHTLDNPNTYGTSAGDSFGECVAIDGDYAIVSASRAPDANGIYAGTVYIYDVATGSLVHTLDNPNPIAAQQDFFGWRVAISGNYAAIGTNKYAGLVHIYDVTTGVLLKTLDNPNAYGTAGGEFFGKSVGISGNYVIAGAPSEADAGGSLAGKAYIFQAL